MGLVTYFKTLLQTYRFHLILAKLDDKYLDIGGGGGMGVKFLGDLPNVITL